MRTASPGPLTSFAFAAFRSFFLLGLLGFRPHTSSNFQAHLKSSERPCAGYRVENGDANMQLPSIDEGLARLQTRRVRGGQPPPRPTL